MRAVFRTQDHFGKRVVAMLLALPSAFFSLGLAALTTTELIRSSSHPNRQLFALRTAACKADIAGVRAQLERGVSAAALWTDTRPGDGGDALAAYFRCFTYGHRFDRELVEVLLAAGATLEVRALNPGALNPLETVVLLARPEDRAEAIEYLVKKGLAPNGTSASEGGTLGIAAYHGDAIAVRRLLDLGAKPNFGRSATRALTGQRDIVCRGLQEPVMKHFSIGAHWEAVDLLLDHGLVITEDDLAAGRKLCEGGTNAIVTHIESRLNQARDADLPLPLRR